MNRIEISVPPTPQLVYAGHIRTDREPLFPEGQPELHTIVFVHRGRLLLTHHNRQYELISGSVFVMEPQQHYMVEAPRDNAAELYFVQFVCKNPGTPRLAPFIEASAAESFAGASIALERCCRTDPKVCVPMLEQIIQAMKHLSIDNLMLVNQLFIQLLMRLHPETTDAKTERSEEISTLVKNYLDANCADEFNTKKMEFELHYHFNYLSRCLKKHTGLTPLQYLQHLRMERAKELLMTTDYSVQNVAEHVGIGDYNYFIRLFKKIEHITPSTYRQTVRRAL